MGGDGGVIASNRKYMRGAGTANHTADSSRFCAKQQESAEQTMTRCRVSGQPLHLDLPVVVCAYGRLYQKEAAVMALLRRREHETDELGSHIRGLKDLQPVQFCIRDNVPVCPVTGKELNGAIPAFCVFPGNGRVNVLSEKALSMKEIVADEYGPIQSTIRLAPPDALLKQIKLELTRKRAFKKKKRKHDGDDKQVTENHEKPKVRKMDDTTASVVLTHKAHGSRSTVVASIFKKDAELTEKERNDNLFVR
jgi:hypothetical protein